QRHHRLHQCDPAGGHSPGFIDNFHGADAIDVEASGGDRSKEGGRNRGCSTGQYLLGDRDFGSSKTHDQRPIGLNGSAGSRSAPKVAGAARESRLLSCRRPSALRRGGAADGSGPGRGGGDLGGGHAIANWLGSCTNTTLRNSPTGSAEATGAA